MELAGFEPAIPYISCLLTQSGFPVSLQPQNGDGSGLLFGMPIRPDRAQRHVAEKVSTSATGRSIVANNVAFATIE